MTSRTTHKAWVIQIVALGLFFFLISPAWAFNVSFWVWQRNAPLNSSEIAELNQAGTKELYWQVGTLVPHDSQWSWREQFPLDFPAIRKLAPSIHFIPVVRLESMTGQSLSVENQSQLVSILDGVIHTSGADMLQIDYECPDRLIPQYKDFLRSLKEHGRAWRLSISALGHWSKFANDFKGLTDEVTPMFYDLNPARESLNGDLLPTLIDAPVVEKQIEAWKDCNVSWKAGLPNFCRVTVVNANGVNRGNVRSWLLDELWFSPLLTPLNSTVDGQTVFTVTHSGALADTPIQPREKVVVRYPNWASLNKLELATEEAGASGVIFFRLADSGDMSGYSVRSLIEARSAPPALTVKWESSGRLSITNSSTNDLLPLVSSSGGRGYALELETKAGSWREAIPGDFAMATTNTNPTGLLEGAVGLNVTTIYFWFSHLRAGQTLETGFVQRVPSASIHWRINNFDSEIQWHLLE